MPSRLGLPSGPDDPRRPCEARAVCFPVATFIHMLEMRCQVQLEVGVTFNQYLAHGEMFMRDALMSSYTVGWLQHQVLQFRIASPYVETLWRLETCFTRLPTDRRTSIDLHFNTRSTLTRTISQTQIVP